MRGRSEVRWLSILATLTAAAAAGAAPGAGSIPPGRRHVLTIEGENAVTFVPRAGLDPFRIDYRARVEYVVNTRRADEAAAPGDGAAGKKSVRKSSAARTKRARADGPAATAAAAVDLSIHSSEMRFRNGPTVVESRLSRSRFQGRLNPEAPEVNVTSGNAPPRLQEVLRSFDTTAATMLLDDDSKVIGRRVRPDLPFRAVAETLLSIHTPIPRDAAFWEAPTQLAMGQGQTAKGILRFEKQKESLAKTGGLVAVKVSGVLKAEGAVVGRLVKDGTYTVTGEQSYDPGTRQWRSARWSVAVATELAAGQGGPTVAHTRGTMLVQSRAVDGPPADADPPAAKP